MGFHDFISSAEASVFTGVSSQTLQRFAEAGYLQVEVDADGITLFSKTELIDVFGLSLSDSIPAKQSSTSEEVLFDGKIQSGNFVPLNEESSPPPSDQTSTQAAAAAPSPHKPIDIKLDEDIVSLRREAEIQEGQDSSAQLRNVQNLDIEYRKLEREVLRLRAVASLQDQLIDLREEEVKDLKGERQWLRSRIEKLEEKGDRDQLLLLSETQVIRKLITIQHEKRSILKSALEWLGISTEENTPVNTIEFRQPPQNGGGAEQK